MAVVGHVNGFLDRGIAAADHRDRLAAVEEAIAGGAGRDPPALQLLLAREVEPARLGAGGDHHRVAGVDGAAVADQSEGTPREIDLDDRVPHHLGADMLGLGLHLLHQPGALDDLGEAGIILDVGRDGQLAAGLDALDDDRREAGAGAVNGGGESGGSGAEDQHAGGMGGWHDRRDRGWGWSGATHLPLPRRLVRGAPPARLWGAVPSAARAISR